MKKRGKSGFIKSVGKGTARGLGKFGRDAATGVISELASILTLGLFKKPRRKRR